jgi:hypothetical protein
LPAVSQSWEWVSRGKKKDSTKIRNKRKGLNWGNSILSSSIGESIKYLKGPIQIKTSSCG